MDLENIEIIVSEIDGVITDGCATLDHLNNTLFKNYCMRDFDAITALKPYFTFVFLSSDPSVSYNVMRTRNIPAYFTTSRDDKITLLTKRILPRYNNRPENLLYIGSVYSDIPCINLAQLSMVPAASVGVTKNASYQIPIEPGKGVLSYAADTLNAEIARRKRKN